MGTKTTNHGMSSFGSEQLRCRLTDELVLLTHLLFHIFVSPFLEEVHIGVLTKLAVELCRLVDTQIRGNHQLVQSKFLD